MLKNALAFAAVRDIDDGIRWYRMLIGKEPDAEPMAGLAEWQFEAGGWLQVNENRKLAGRSSLTLVETDIDERLKQLKQAGIEQGWYLEVRRSALSSSATLTAIRLFLLRERTGSIYRRCNEPSVVR